MSYPLVFDISHSEGEGVLFEWKKKSVKQWLYDTIYFISFLFLPIHTLQNTGFRVEGKKMATNLNGPTRLI